MSAGTGDVGMCSHNCWGVTGVPRCEVDCMCLSLLGKIAFLTGVPSMVLKDIVVEGEAEDKDSALVCQFFLFPSALVTQLLIKTLVLLSAVHAKLMLKFYIWTIFRCVLVAAEQISKRVVRCK